MPRKVGDGFQCYVIVLVSSSVFHLTFLFQLQGLFREQSLRLFELQWNQLVAVLYP